MSIDSGRMRAIISQPTDGLSDAEIAVTRERAANALEAHGYRVVNEPPPDERAVVYFCRGWERSSVCREQHRSATIAGMGIMYE